jgi:hypothetical protein
MSNCKCGHSLEQHDEYVCPSECEKCEGRPNVPCNCEAQACQECGCYYFDPTKELEV